MYIDSHNLFSMEVDFNPNQLLITQNHPLIISHCSRIVKIHWHFIPAKYFFPNILLDMTTRVSSLDFLESLKLSGSLSVTFYHKQEQQENGVEQLVFHASTLVITMQFDFVGVRNDSLFKYHKQILQAQIL